MTPTCPPNCRCGFIVDDDEKPPIVQGGLAFIERDITWFGVPYCSNSGVAALENPGGHVVEFLTFDDVDEAIEKCWRALGGAPGQLAG
jgi:hypothetical protein